MLVLATTVSSTKRPGVPLTQELSGRAAKRACSSYVRAVSRVKGPEVLLAQEQSGGVAIRAHPSSARTMSTEERQEVLLMREQSGWVFSEGLEGAVCLRGLEDTAYSVGGLGQVLSKGRCRLTLPPVRFRFHCLFPN